MKVYVGEFDLHFWAGLLLLLLLILEIADRVVMKRDLQIAREIQTWLLPGVPPQIPGLAIAYATRPANTVAGDYYDVFPRPGRTNEDNRVVLAVADVAGKSIPAAMLMATFQASLKTLSTAQVALPELAANMNRYACAQQPGRIAFHHCVSRGVRSRPPHASTTSTPATTIPFCAAPADKSSASMSAAFPSASCRR